MSDQFHLFAEGVERQFRAMSGGELFVVDALDIFESYLAAFPEGTNPIFRERTEHDCSCCKNFIRNIGHVVALDGERIETVWDVENLPYPYDVVAEAMAARVRQLPIRSVYRTQERRYGNQQTIEALENGKSITWKHFFCSVPDHIHTKSPDKDRGEIETKFQVFSRAINELSLSSVDTVLELIADKAIYRGEEHLRAVQAFRKLLVGFPNGSSLANTAYLRKNVNEFGALIRNTVIGSLLVDLSAGDDLERAVRSYEKKVAPENYKRSKAVVTQRMIDDAMKTITDLGLEPAIERRFARIDDVSVNNVLFVDNAVRGKMKQGGLAGLLSASVKAPKVEIKDAAQISIDEFMATIVPKSVSIDVLVQNRHQGNFMSLTAPVHDDAPSLFRWNNGFAWSYDGEVADSMRQRVEARGGRVDGVLRFTHQWNDVDRNASLMDLHVFMPGHPFSKVLKPDGQNDSYGVSQRSEDRNRVGWNHRSHSASGGVQDVDYVDAAPEGYVPVENITFPDLRRMPDGDYVMKIHNWALRHPTKSGFTAEIEFGGQIFRYEHPQPLKNKEWVTLAVVTLKAGVFSIRHIHPTSTASQKKWGIDTETLVPVDTIMASPNHWDGNASGNKHWFFMLKGMKNPSPVRGLYNEFLGSDLERHRKVFELIGAKTRAEPTDDQLSGVGFSSTRGDTVTVVAKGEGFARAYDVQF